MKRVLQCAREARARPLRCAQKAVTQVDMIARLPSGDASTRIRPVIDADRGTSRRRPMNQVKINRRSRS
jgi:hypothetical protein